MISYKTYRDGLIKCGANPSEIMSEEEYAIKYPSDDEPKYEPKLLVRTKRDSRLVVPSLEVHSKPVKPPKKVRERKSNRLSPNSLSREEMRERRNQKMREKRELRKQAGLTTKGTIPKEPKPKLSDDEKRKRRTQYNKNWQVNNREHHLAYRKALREKKKNELLKSEN